MAKKPSYEELEQTIRELKKERTDRIRVEEALKKSEQEKSAILDSLVEHVIHEDMDMKIQWANRAACESAGMPLEELIGRHCYEIWPQRSDPCPDCPVIYAIKTGQPQEIEKTTPDRRAWYIRGYPVRDVHGETVGGTELTLEITKRKHLEETLKESEERYRVSIESAPYGIMIHDHDGKIFILNSQFEKITGYSKEEIPDVKTWIEKAYPDEEYRTLVMDERRTVTPEENPRIKEAVITRKDGERRICQFVSSLLPSGMRTVFITDITSRKQAEKDLRSEKDKLQALMDGLDRTRIGIDIIGSDYTILFQNQMLKERFGDVTGQLCYEKYRGLEKPCDFCPVVGVIKSNKVESVQLTGNDGRTYELFSAPLPNPDGTVDSAIEVVLDITYRKQAEEALKESEARYRTILDSIEEGYFEVDLTGTLTFFNEALCTITGYTHNEILGMNNREYTTQETAEKMYQTFNRVYRAGKPLQMLDYEIMVKDGKKMVVEMSISLMRNPEGTPIGFRGILRDITSRKQAEQALLESEERYRTLAEQSTDAIYITTRQGKLTYINQSFLGLFDYTPKELEGLKAQDFYVNPEDRSRYQQAVEATGSVRDFEVKLRRKDNTAIDCLITANTRMAGDGHIIGYQGIIRDITEKKTLESQLLQAQKMEAIGTLAGGIAHNFNNLLMAIQGNASLMLLDTPSEHPHYEKLATIEQLVQSGAKLTSQLLGYARGGRYAIKPISINRIITDTLATFSMARKDITIHQELAKNLSGVRADQGQIEQVFLNIYVNAAEAMPYGGNLFITTQAIAHTEITGKPYTVKPGNYILITLRDTGIGMDKATKAKIFDPFFTTKGLAKGTGLGLASVYGIMKAHGGYIDVESKKGKGTTFSLYLPASKGEGIAKRAVNGKRMEIAPGKETVLVVDDEEMVLTVGEQILKKLGYSVLTANSGKEAIDTYKANREKIDIVILDMIMPGMGGGETYDRMKEMHPRIKVLLSSGYRINGQATEILQRGCDGFIQKPFTMRELSAAIREVLDKE